MRALKLGTAATVAAAGSILALGGPAAAAGAPDEQAPCLAHVFQSQAVSAPQTVSNRILEIRDEAWEDGTSCAGLVLDPTLVPVAARPVKPFQGWRYLEPAAAPLDVAAGAEAEGLEALPARLRQELRSLGLI